MVLLRYAGQTKIPSTMKSGDFLKMMLRVIRVFQVFKNNVKYNVKF